MANYKLQAALPVATATGASIRSSFHSVMALLIAALVVAVIYLARDTEPQPSPEEVEAEVLRSDGGLSGILTSPPPSQPPPLPEKCDLFSGRWVYDNVSYPLYKEHDCKFMSDYLTCEKNGRKDLNYQHWRWQPHQCDLPRFNATVLLEELRNKRMVFVGDSLNRGQWVSMVCLVESAIANSSLKSMSYHLNASLIIFKAQEYNATIEYYWEPLLVESNSDDPINHRVPNRIVRVHSIEKHARHWSGAEFLVFDTYLWWRLPRMKVLWGSFESPNGIYKDVNMPRAYEMALNTWSDWLEIHVNRTKTRMFFMSASPTHEKAEEWGGEVGQNCYQETELITKQDYWGTGSDRDMMRTVESAINSLEARGVTVQLLNITQLSEYRKEAHLSVFRKQWEPAKKEELAYPLSYADCYHWCLPGVQDVWNELLYAYIFQNHQMPKSKASVEV